MAYDTMNPWFHPDPYGPMPAYRSLALGDSGSRIILSAEQSRIMDRATGVMALMGGAASAGAIILVSTLIIGAIAYSMRKT